MANYEVEEVIAGDGWAVQRVGPWVLGVWNAPMTEERVMTCQRLYRSAQKAHGRFSVYSRHRSNPFPLEMLAGQRSRDLVISLLREFDETFEVFLVGIEGDGFQASLMRLGAAAVVHQMRRVMPIVFTASLEEGLKEVRSRRLGHVVDTITLESHMRALEVRAAG